MIWRLSNRPTSSEVQDLMSSGIITKDEAREILFSEQEENERDIKSLEAEIKFLREIVERLSARRSNIVETIRYVEKPYYQQPWYRPYAVWCGSGGNLNVATAGMNTISTLNSTGSATYTNASQASAAGGSSNAFTAIATF